MKSNIKQIMNKKNVTIRGLETSSGVTNVTILKARKDETIVKCTLETLAKIAHALDCRVKDLFEDDDQETTA